MEFDQSVHAFLRTGSWIFGDVMNPVEIEKGIAYVRHNGIRIGNVSDSSGGVLVQFTYHGTAVAWVRMEGSQLGTIRHLSLSGIEGRHRVKQN